MRAPIFCGEPLAVDIEQRNGRIVSHHDRIPWCHIIDRARPLPHHSVCSLRMSQVDSQREPISALEGSYLIRLMEPHVAELLTKRQQSVCASCSAGRNLPLAVSEPRTLLLSMMTSSLELPPAAATAVERLGRAMRDVRPTPPVRDVLGSTDIALAYAVQDAVIRKRLAAGAVIVGRKVGLTSQAVQQQLGVSQPDSGVLFADMAVRNGGTIDRRTLIAPRVEAEVAFALKTDIDMDPNEINYAVAVAAVDHAVAALEIVDSRIADWDITITDTVADNASSGLYILGDTRVPLGDFTPAEVRMTLHMDGQCPSWGRGTACLGDPINALVWLARTVAKHGCPLRAGEVVLSGALGPMVTPGCPSQIVAELSVLGTVGARFAT